MLNSNVKLAEIKTARLSNGEGPLIPPEIRNLTQVFNSNFKTLPLEFQQPYIDEAVQRRAAPAEQASFDDDSTDDYNSDRRWNACDKANPVLPELIEEVLVASMADSRSTRNT